jgi:hypothetical protein
MHARGDLDDEEFREIKRTCKQHLQAELKDAQEKGYSQRTDDSISAKPAD